MGIYRHYFSILLKSELSHRKSFFLMMFGQFFTPFSLFIGFYMLFLRFGSIKGYSFYEMALCYGVAHISFSMAELFARGFDSFSILIRNAGMDRLMLRPRNLALQVMGSRIALMKLGVFAQGLIVLGIAVSGLSIQWNLLKVWLLFSMIFGSFIVFVGVLILCATLCFFTIEGIEAANIITHGGREVSQFPLSIYENGFRIFFTFLIPFGMTSFYPMMIFLDKSPVEFKYLLSPFYALFFTALCVLIWYQGLKHYQSTGS